MENSLKWEIKHKFKINPPAGGEKLKNEDIVDVLLENRGLKTKKDIDDFLNPKLETVTVGAVGIDKKQLKKAIERIQKAIDKKEQIVVFGDYDVDGITGSAILWETLHNLGANVLPYIPNRVEEGYGLSSKGISNVKSQMSNLKLIITVDNGVVANEAVDFANKQGIDVIITDHHVSSKKLPDAYAIVHTTKLCGAGVAFLLAQELKTQNSKLKTNEENHLELVALATIADMVPLTGQNRTLVVYGLKALRKTKRLGLRALFEESGVDQAVGIGVYEIGHMIAPRLNASGRMASAMDSLRLLCTRDITRAKQLANKLGQTNRERQIEMSGAAEHAISQIANRIHSTGSGSSKSQIAKLLFISHERYQQGTIGLVAGKLVEQFYRPAIVVAIGETESKASARSVKGFNMIEFLREHSKYFVNVGGHPMAAGFTIETEKITVLQIALEKSAEKALRGDVLTRKIRVDCELPLSMVSQKLYKEIQQLSPFGVGNPEPTFLGKHVVIEDLRKVGKDGKHLKIRISELGVMFDAVGFGLGERSDNLSIGKSIDIVYTLNENRWNGNKQLELKIKDFKVV